MPVASEDALLQDLLKTAEAEQQKLSRPAALAAPADDDPLFADLLKTAEAEQQKLSAGARPPVLPDVTAMPENVAGPGGLPAERPLYPTLLSTGAPTPQDVQRMAAFTLGSDVAASPPPPPPRSFQVKPLRFVQSPEEMAYEGARGKERELPPFAQAPGYRGAEGGPVARTRADRTRATAKLGASLPRLWDEFAQSKAAWDAEEQRLAQLVAGSKRRPFSPVEARSYQAALKAHQENQRLLQQRQKRLLGYQGQTEAVRKRYEKEPLHSGMDYAEERSGREASFGTQVGRQFLQSTPEWVKKAGAFVNPAQAITEAEGRMREARAQLMLEGAYPELPEPPGSGNVRPLLIRQKNDLLRALIALPGQVSPTGEMLPVQSGFGGGPGWAVQIIENLTPWQRQILPVLQQQIRAEQKAAEMAGLGKAITTDLVSNAVGELLGGMAARAILRRTAPIVERFTTRLTGAGMKPRVAAALVRGVPAVTSGAASGAVGSASGAAIATGAQGGTPEEIGTAALRALGPGAAIGGIFGAAEAGVGAARAVRRPRPTPPVPEAVVEPVAPSAVPDPRMDAARAQRHQAWQQSLAVDLPAEAIPAYQKVWGDQKTPARARYNQFETQAELRESTNPALAEKLRQAAEETRAEFTRNWLSRSEWADPNAPFVEPAVEPSVWRTLTDEERASLPPDLREKLLLHDINRSVQTLTPGTDPVILPRDVPGKPKNRAQLEATADQLFADAQRQVDALLAVPEVAPAPRTAEDVAVAQQRAEAAVEQVRAAEPGAQAAAEQVMAQVPEVQARAAEAAGALDTLAETIAPPPVITPLGEALPPAAGPEVGSTARRGKKTPAAPVETAPVAEAPASRLQPITEADLTPGQRVVNPKTGAEYGLVQVYETGQMEGRWQARVIDPGSDAKLKAGSLGAIKPELLTRDYQKVAGAPRTDLAQRKRVAEMSLEEAQQALLTSPKTGIPGLLAYQDAPKKPWQGEVDADSLKWWNDEFGPIAGDEGGDALLRNVAQSLEKAGLEAYHISGDEFVVQGDDRAVLESRLALANDILKESVVEFTTADGRTLRFKGAEISHGIAPLAEGEKPYVEANAALKAAKQQREAAGVRAPRGERPPGVVEISEGAGKPGGQPQLARGAAQPRAGRGAKKEARAVTPEARKASKPVATGRKAKFRAGDTKAEGQWAVYNVGDVVTSNTDSLAVNPDYPAELQPRDRERAASREQIASLERKMDPELMGENPLAQHGAPIVGPDGAVESGNGRTIALRRLYGRGDAKAAEYKNWLIENAEAFGLDPEAVRQAKAPVLVRVRTTEMSPEQRVAFTQSANARETAAMGVTETAKGDAAKLTGPLMAKFDPGEGVDVTTASNRDFVRDFIATLPQSERAGMLTADGRLSQEGATRIRNAVFQWAYGDPRALTRLAEATDDPARNVTQGMLRAAPFIGEVRQRVEAGTAFPVDIAPDLAAAAGRLAALREEGTSVADFLAQGGLFGEDLTPFQKEILVYLDTNKRSAKKITAALAAYRDAALKAGDPSTGSLFDDIAPPTKEEVWQAAIQKVEEYDAGQPQLFATPLKAGQGAARGGGAVEAPPARPGAQEGAGRKGGAAPEVGRKGGQVDLIDDPELMANYRETETPPSETWKERNLPTLNRVWAGLTRTVPTLPNTPEYATMRAWRRETNALDQIASYRIKKALQEELDGLTGTERDGFSQSLNVRNMAQNVRRQMEQWIEAGKDPALFEARLPGKWTEQKVRDQLKNIDAYLEKNPKVKKALEDLPKARAEIAGEIKALYKKVAGKDLELDFEDYMHQATIAYAAGKRAMGGKGKGRPGFTQHREGSELDYYTNFIESETRWMDSAVRKIQALKLWDIVLDQHDKTAEVKARLADLNDKRFVPALENISRGTIDPAALDTLGELAVADGLPDQRGGKFEPLIDDLEAYHQAKQKGQGYTLTPEAQKLLPEYAKWLLTKRKGVALPPGGKLPKGYTEIPIDEVSNVFSAQVVPQTMMKNAQQAVGGMLGIDPADLRKVMALGRRKSIIVPDAVAETLMEWSRPRKGEWDDVVHRGLAVWQGVWKAEKLFNPLRGTGYWIMNRISGLQRQFRGMGAQAQMRQGPRAMMDVAKLLAGVGKPPPLLQAWVTRGGLSGLLTQQEGLGKVLPGGQVGPFSTRPVPAGQRAKDLVGAIIHFPHDWAEGAERYASFTEFVQQMERDLKRGGDGRPDTFAFSDPKEVMGLKSVYDRAYKLSNDMSGNYDEMTAAGRYIRKHWSPFFSWTETLFRTEAQHFKNIWEEPRFAAAAGRKLLGGNVGTATLINAGRFALKAMTLKFMLDAWNYTQHPEAMDKLPEESRGRPVLVTHYDKETGELHFYDRLDNLNEIAAWFGADGWQYSPYLAAAKGSLGDGKTGTYWQDWASGRMTLPEIGREMAQAFGNKVWQSVGPGPKLLAETVTKTTTFPNVFSPRPSRDPLEGVLDNYGLGGVYRSYHRRPLRRGEGMVPGVPERLNPRYRKLQGYRTVDVEESNYYETKDMARQWKRKQGDGGDEPGGGGFTPKGNALFRHKEALRFGDIDEADRRLKEYVDLGGRGKDYVTSITSNDPLEGLTRGENVAGFRRSEQAKFLESLSPADAARVRRAYRHYQQLVAPGLSEAMDMVTDRAPDLSTWVLSVRRLIERSLERENPLKELQQEDEDVRLKLRQNERARRR